MMIMFLHVASLSWNVGMADRHFSVSRLGAVDVRMGSHGNTAPSNTHATVVLLRHGQSVWNEASLFTGWADVELTTLGKNEAAGAATTLWREGFKFDVAFSSRLSRAMQTLDIVLQITDQARGIVPIRSVQIRSTPTGQLIIWSNVSGRHPRSSDFSSE